MAETVEIDARGRLTLSDALREAGHIQAPGKLSVRVRPDGLLLCARPSELPEEVAQLASLNGPIDAWAVLEQEIEVERLRRTESRRIPQAFDCAALPELSAEARDRLAQLRPATIGHASRIAGGSPADVALHMVRVQRTAASPNSPPGAPAARRTFV